MKLFANKKLDHLMREMGRGYELQEARNLEEAISVYKGVLEETKRLGLDFSYVLWNLAATEHSPLSRRRIRAVECTGTVALNKTLSPAGADTLLGSLSAAQYT